MNSLLIIAAVVGAASAGVINYGSSVGYPFTYSSGYAGLAGYDGVTTLGGSKSYGYSYSAQPQIQSVPVVHQPAAYAAPVVHQSSAYAAPVAHSQYVPVQHSSPVVYSNGYTNGYSNLGGYALGGATYGNSHVVLPSAQYSIAH